MTKGIITFLIFSYIFGHKFWISLLMGHVIKSTVGPELLCDSLYDHGRGVVPFWAKAHVEDAEIS